MAFSPDGKLLASGGQDYTVRIFDPFSGNKIITYKMDNPITSLAFSPDGKILAVCTRDRVIRLLDLTGAEEQKVLLGHSSYVNSIAFSPDGKKLLSGGNDATARLWDVDRRKEICRFYQSPRVSCVAFSPDGQILALAHSSIRIVRFHPAVPSEEQFTRVFSKAKLTLVGTDLTETIETP